MKTEKKVKLDKIDDVDDKDDNFLENIVKEGKFSFNLLV